MEKGNESYVIDCNVVIKWFRLKEEHSEQTLFLFEKAAKREVILYSPAIIATEFLNVLTKLHKRYSISIIEINKYFESFQKSCNQRIVNLICQDDNRDEILNLALAEKLSYYDAEYLYLSKKLKLELITYDKYLRKITDR